MRYLVIASMRNEGPFIVEWVCWYRMLGFTDIMVVTNDCTDHSPRLLRALERAGWLTQFDITPRPNQPLLHTKLLAAKARPETQAADWVFVCDVDEFLVVHAGDGRISDLLDLGPPGFLGMAVNWRVFGNSGHGEWQDKPVHRWFNRAARRSADSSRWLKSVFRRQDYFRVFAPHSPHRLDPSKLAGAWGQDDRRWVNSAGETLSGWVPGREKPMMMMAPEQVTFDRAQINHYMIRTLENFEMKRGNPSTAAGADRYTDTYLKSFNRNEVEDVSALAHADRFDLMHAEAMALPRVRRLHHLCCADFVLRAGAKLGFDGRADPRYAHHMAMSRTAG